MVDVARARKLAVRIREIVAATLEMQVKDGDDHGHEGHP